MILIFLFVVKKLTNNLNRLLMRHIFVLRNGQGDMKKQFSKGQTAAEAAKRKRYNLDLAETITHLSMLRYSHFHDLNSGRDSPLNTFFLNSTMEKT